MRRINYSFKSRLFGAIATICVLPAGVGAAVSSNGEYVTGAIPIAPTSDAAYGGTSVFVGQGSYGVGTESILRVDADGTTTVLVTNLNSIGGIAFDEEGNRLLFTDNGLEAPPGTATTGDTVYALPSPLSAVGSVAADTLEMLPAGSMAFAQAVLPLPGGSILVGDATGFGTGRVVSVTSGVGTDLVTGLDYTAGLALSPSGTEIYVGQVDSSTFLGSVDRFDLAGSPLGAYATGLSGLFEQEFDAGGRLIATGGFTPDFSSSTVARLDGVNPPESVETGYVFTSGMDIDGPSGQIAVVDFGAPQIDTLTPIEQLTPGGKGKKECQTELWGQDPDRSKSGRPRNRWTCEDGDPSCDRDVAVDGSCTFLIGACFTIPDDRAPKCTPAPVDSAEVERRPKVNGSGAFPELQAVVDATLPTTEASCSLGVPITVEAGDKVKILITSYAAGKKADKDKVTLKCERP